MRIDTATTAHIGLTPSERVTMIAALSLWASIDNQVVRNLMIQGVHQSGMLVDVSAIDLDSVLELQHKLGAEPRFAVAG